MAQLKLPKDQVIELRAQSHHLEPVVLLGNAGLTAAVKKEVDRALDAHGLIKVRVPSDDREERVEIYNTLAEELKAAKIQQIGKLFVLYRPIPEKKKGAKPAGEEAVKKPRKTGAKARNQRKRLTQLIEQKKKGSKPQSLPWGKTKAGKTPKGQVKAVGRKGTVLGKKLAAKQAKH